jgi:predicted unusual protein kinase regulating ubiquinone biosynthesis (AarF/ABC1/UbiB family)
MPNGSVEETLFTTFLEVLPKHEHAVALSYMLSLAKEEGGGSAAQLFEVFGTVGIKFGQLAAIWKLFGEKVAQDAEHLKNHAKALSRFEVMNLAYSRHHEVQPLIQEFEKILGSASIKTTTRVRFKDGSIGVLALQGKNVKEILTMNIDLGKKYLAKLKEKGVIQNSKFMVNLVEALEEQIMGELDMTSETTKMKKANEILKAINKDLKSEMNGWTMKVPQALPGKPTTSQLAFYDLAKSKTFDQLAPEVRAEIGPMIVKSSLKALFQYGWFDPDRHTGNFLLDEETKTIHFLDFGQFEDFSKSSNPFKADPRLVIGQFIKSLSEMDAHAVIHYGRLMARPGSESEINEIRLQARVEALFAKARAQKDGDVKTLMVDVINELADSGLKFDTRYIFGGLKGLIVLYGENYITPTEFEAALKSELKSLFVKKLPVLFSDSLRSKKPQPLSRALRCQQALAPL